MLKIESVYATEPMLSFSFRYVSANTTTVVIHCLEGTVHIPVVILKTNFVKYLI